MSFDWSDYLDLARSLSSGPPGEAALRSAISRAYYAAYHCASRYVRAQELVDASTELRHDLVWRQFNQLSDDSLRPVALLGFRLKQQRLFADYRMPFPGVLRDAAAVAIDDAAEIVGRVERVWPAGD